MRSENGGFVEEMVDLEVPRRLWSAPGLPPLLIVPPDAIEKERALEPLSTIFPAPVRPAPRDRWLDFGSGYGLFSIFAKRLEAELIVAIEPDELAAEYAGRALYLEGLAPPATAEVDSDTLAGMVETFELNAVRLSGAPWIDLGALPNVRKVIERTTAGRVAVRLEALGKLYSSVSTSTGAGWGDCYLFAWGRRAAR
jgi:SAM-dependent methyltransferase